MWIKSYEFYKIKQLIDKFLFLNQKGGHVSVSYWAILVRLDRPLWCVGSKLQRMAQICLYLFDYESIVTLGSGSSGSQQLDLRWAALTRRRVAACSDEGGAGDAGSKRDRGGAHRDRRASLMLNMAVSRRGAHGGDADCSPEFCLASGSSARRRRRRCRVF